MIEVSLKSSDLVYLSISLLEVPNPRALIQIIPGFKEHKERYYEFANYLNTFGFSVVISDIRGHGKSINGSYPLGYIDDYQKLINDQIIITNYIKNRYGNIPIFLLGDSLGVEISMGYIEKNDLNIQKLILCSPIKPNKNLNIWLNTINLSLKFQKDKVNSLFQGAIGLDKIDNLFQDINAKNIFKNDELCNFGYTNMAIKNLLLLNKEVMSLNSYSPQNKNLPILILYGMLDNEISGKEGVLQIISGLNKIGYQNIENIEYPNMYHKILFEGARKLVYDDIIKFLIK